jgi:hypothetical protein
LVAHDCRGGGTRRCRICVSQMHDHEKSRQAGKCKPELQYARCTGFIWIGDVPKLLRYAIYAPLVEHPGSNEPVNPACRAASKVKSQRLSRQPNYY